MSTPAPIFSKLFALSVAVLCLCSAQFVSAATMSLFAGSTNVSAGDLVTVRVIVNAQGQAINTAEGTVQFPTDTLSVLSVDKSSSIFSLWVQDPSFSNQAGTISFNGGLPSPGYQGSNGNVLNIVFQAKRTGTATLSISGATVRANDGFGTDVLQSTNGTQLTITNAQPSQVATPPVKSTQAVQQTVIPSGLRVPQFSYDSSSGMLDITLPSQDVGPSIASYNVSIDGEASTSVPLEAFVNGLYRLTVHVSGKHSVVLEVTNNSGVSTDSAGSFTVPTIPPPVLQQLPTHLNSGDQLIIGGTAPKDDAQIHIYIAKDGGNPQAFTVTPDSSGDFDLLGPTVGQGTYGFWAEGISGGGIISAPTPKMYVSVSAGSVLNLGQWGISLSSLLLIMLLFSIASFVVAGLALYRLHTYHARRLDTVQKIDAEVHRAILLFRGDMEGHLDALEKASTKRQLTAEEAKLREDVKSHLTILGKYIEKELR